MAFDNGDQTTSSSAKESTHLEDQDSEKGISNGEDVNNSAAAEKKAQNTAVLPNEKEKDPNLVGWEGMIASSLDVQMNPTEISL